VGQSSEDVQKIIGDVLERGKIVKIKEIEITEEFGCIKKYRTVYKLEYIKGEYKFTEVIVIVQDDGKIITAYPSEPKPLKGQINNVFPGGWEDE